MAERNPQVMEMVAKELESDPGVKADVLFDKAREIDPKIGELSLRQFHARYPLPLKRKRSGGKRAGGRAAKAGAGRSGRRAGPRPKGKREASPRDQVRRIFLDFASELAGADSRAAIVDVLGRVDDYVDLVMEKAGR